MELSTAHRPAGGSARKPDKVLCIQRGETSEARGILGAFLEEVALQQGFERLTDFEHLEMIHSIIFLYYIALLGTCQYK